MTMLLASLLELLKRLDAARIRHSLDSIRPEAIMVLVLVPGQRWEIELTADGTVEVERFLSDGTIQDAGAIERLFADFTG
jgi:hypothetical protein